MVSFAAAFVASIGLQSAADVNYDIFSTEALRCVIGDNTAMGVHRAGYNGVFELTIPGSARNVFVPHYAGLNLEHYFDAAPVSENREVFFEPRVAPMTFRRIDDLTAELHQPPTPVYQVESWTRFTLIEPHYLDFTFRCVPHRDDLAGNVLGVFWASYINAPADKSIYFLHEGSSLDAPEWVQYCTLQHGRDSTVRHQDDHVEINFEGGRGALFNNIAPLRYAEPFFYGRVEDHVLIFIFTPGPCIRFSHSPSGGGKTDDGQAHNPAWDFQLIVPDYEAGREYGLTMRLVYKPWKSRDDVIAEVRKYREL